MLDEHVLDPTAGERARRLHEHPEAVEPVSDPTAGEHARRSRLAPDSQPIVDPTDPRSGRPPAGGRLRGVDEPF